MRNDFILYIVNIIERCIRCIHEIYKNNPKHLKNIVKRDKIILNLQQACEGCITLAIHIVAEKKLGMPHNNMEAFNLLETEGVIPTSLSKKMKDLLFRDYQYINLKSLQDVLENHLVDFFHYTKTIQSY
ncbi:type VII toxin-antitoxin system HepT family RNase toxin [Mesobacillus foraminis]|uniref:type VII toxin-antitoxin system HepT family RNase toxin n=1 Tax=Mesobacillus foraminis TaxID=279826 RepID=UPI000EF45ED3|nr:HepT-like ribonuclease domain-containing protein [Mesobacillus foraminis]